MTPSDWLVCIPARMQSTRLAEKMMADIAGKPLIIRVWQNLQPLRDTGMKTVIATDSERILKLCEDAGAEACLTAVDHANGTSRCAEVAKIKETPYILNVQGDEPLLDCQDLKNLTQAFTDPSVQMATLRHPETDPSLFFDPNCIKVVGYPKAHYFSRAPIPWPRGIVQQSHSSDPVELPESFRFWTHIGVYAYDRKTLMNFASLSSTNLEKWEKLEQLRALENGISIHLVDANSKCRGVDTADDLEHVRKEWIKKYGSD